MPPDDRTSTDAQYVIVSLRKGLPNSGLQINGFGLPWTPANTRSGVSICTDHAPQVLNAKIIIGRSSFQAGTGRPSNQRRILGLSTISKIPIENRHQIAGTSLGLLVN